MPSVLQRLPVAYTRVLSTSPLVVSDSSDSHIAWTCTHKKTKVREFLLPDALSPCYLQHKTGVLSPLRRPIFHPQARSQRHLPSVFPVAPPTKALFPFLKTLEPVPTNNQAPEGELVDLACWAEANFTITRAPSPVCHTPQRAPYCPVFLTVSRSGSISLPSALLLLMNSHALISMTLPSTPIQIRPSIISHIVNTCSWTFSSHEHLRKLLWKQSECS